MNIKLSLKRSCYAAETIGQDITIYLRQCYTVYDVLESIDHEIKHAQINKFKRGTTAKQDHYIIRLWDMNIF